MAEKKAKTAEKSSPIQKRMCPTCNSEAKVTMYAGFGPRGFFWVCEKNCGYSQRTR